MNAAPQNAKSFVRRSNFRGSVALASDLLVLTALILVGLHFNHWALYLLLAWPIGLVQFAMGEALAHEASHYNLFSTRHLNNKAEWILTIPFFYTLADYRKEHHLHHNKLGRSEDHLVSDYRSRGLFRIPPKLFWIWFGKPLVGIAGIAYLKSVCFDLMSPRAAMKLLPFWIGIITIGLATGTFSFIFWLWLFPLIWTFSSFLWWSEIRDHFNTKTGTRTDVGWMNYVTHNSGYHSVHHKYPSIPWYLLQEAHETLCAEESADTCNGFFDAFRQMLPPSEPASDQTQIALSEQ